MSAGGFEHVALSFAVLDDGRGFVLRHGPLRRRDDGRAELFELDDPEIAVLLADVTEVEFSYFGAADQRDDAEWTDRWEDQERLPLLVRIRIGLAESDRRIWPELTVPLRIQGEISAAPGGPRR